ncbi:hypothetical protein Pcinc_010191 [Petrolisthes cinctipes]|uniref:Transposase n=1 Tax=Petrolisthes cinctipes TaxID=88211 RepID=A0AAE1G391_PETCI|nr:hypothetical protein Pcinc_010191 [Petrolisthes cinctipes]
MVRNELGLSNKTICDWARFCREVLIEWSVKRQGKIGGKGMIVEIDESKFGKRKYNCNFVDPTTLAHTNTVERLWREVKLKVPLFGRRKKHFLGYLARSMFVMAFEEDKRFHQFLLEVASLYNPLHPPHPQP